MISNSETTEHVYQTPLPQRKLNQTQPVKEIDIDVQRPVINSHKMIRRSELSTINDQSFINTPPVRLDDNNNEISPSKHEKNEITLITANINITTRLNNTNHHHSTPTKPHDLFDSKQTPVPLLSTTKSVANRQTTTHDKLMLQHMHDSRIQQLYGVKEANLEMQRLDITNSQMKRAHFIESPTRISPESTNVTKNTASTAAQFKTLKKQMDDFRRDLIAETRNTSNTNEEFPPESESIYITPDTSPSNILDESKVKEEKTSPVVEPPIKDHVLSPSKLQDVKRPSMTVTRIDKSSQDHDEYLYLYMSSEKYAKIFERRFIELDRLIHNGKFTSAILLTSLPPTKSDLELLAELYGANVILDRRSVQCYIKLRKEILESFKNSLIKIGENKYLFMKNICFTTSFPKHEFRSNYQV